jgi:hypothetical protein
LCNRRTQRVDLDVIREAPPTVDLDDRQPLAIFGLERLVAGDIHLAQREPELGLERPDLLQSPLAKVAALRVEDDDVDGYG